MSDFYKDYFIPTKMGVLLKFKIFLDDVKPRIYFGKEYCVFHTICYDYFDPMGTHEESYSSVDSKLFSEDSSVLPKVVKVTVFKVTMETEDFYA